MILENEKYRVGQSHTLCKKVKNTNVHSNHTVTTTLNALL